eukprot:g1429.t1
MDVLPKQVNDFRSKKYWDKFFAKQNGESFEWYGTYSQLAKLLNIYCAKDGPTLLVGCGNSNLGEEMSTHQYTNLVGVDYSTAAISEMQMKGSGKVEYEVGDCHDLVYEDESFPTVLDKAWLDAVASDNSAEVAMDVSSMFGELNRILLRGGTYVCVTLAEYYVLDLLLGFFDDGWTIDVHRVKTNAKLQPFFFACHKMKESDAPRVIRLHFSDEVEGRGEKNIVELKGDTAGRICAERIKRVQNATRARQQLNQLAAKEGGERYETSLWSTKDEKNTSPRYVLTVHDRRGGAVRGQPRCAVLLVPPERFRDYSFATSEGRSSLCNDHNFGRIVFVRLHPAHQHDTMENAQLELNGLVSDLADNGVKQSGESIPYVTIGEDNSGNRDRVGEVNSMVIEECDDAEREDGRLRQLIFLDNPGMIQSEAKLVEKKVGVEKTKLKGALQQVRKKQGGGGSRRKKGKGKKKKKKKGRKKKEEEEHSDDGENEVELIIDHSRLQFEFHSAMAASVALLRPLTEERMRKSLIIGVGGGLLPMFLLHHFSSSMEIDTVELDNTVVDVAKEYFDFNTEKINSYVEDGIKFVNDKAKENQKKWDVIMIDVSDGSSTAVANGMTAPTPSFIDQDWLVNVKSILHEHGVLAINVCCRSEALYKTALESVKKVFKVVDEVQAGEDALNRVWYAMEDRENETSEKKVERLKKWSDTKEEKYWAIPAHSAPADEAKWRAGGLEGELKRWLMQTEKKEEVKKKKKRKKKRRK